MAAGSVGVSSTTQPCPAPMRPGKRGAQSVASPSVSSSRPADPGAPPETPNSPMMAPPRTRPRQPAQGATGQPPRLEAAAGYQPAAAPAFEVDNGRALHGSGHIRPVAAVGEGHDRIDHRMRHGYHQIWHAIAAAWRLDGGDDPGVPAELAGRLDVGRGGVPCLRAAQTQRDLTGGVVTRVRRRPWSRPGRQGLARGRNWPGLRAGSCGASSRQQSVASRPAAPPPRGPPRPISGFRLE